MKSWPCSICKKLISELGAYLKVNNKTYQHLRCAQDSIYEAGRLAGRQEVLDEQGALARAVEERAQAVAQAKAEQAQAKAAALETARLNKLRIDNLTAAAREALKREMQGTGGERFELIEVATPEEMAAQEAARQAEDAKKIPKCVRCGVATTSTDHPGHCDKCWNIDPAKPVQQDLESDIKEALKRGVRPLELE